MGQDSVLGLATAGWTQVEFNVLGLGNNSVAVFNQGTVITVKTSVNSGVTASPNWTIGGKSAETSNMSFVASSGCSIAGVTGGVWPSLQFIEAPGTPPIPVPFCLQEDTVPILLPLW
jgi:hypothetical protein